MIKRIGSTRSGGSEAQEQGGRRRRKRIKRHRKGKRGKSIGFCQGWRRKRWNRYWYEEKRRRKSYKELQGKSEQQQT